MKAHSRNDRGCGGGSLLTCTHLASLDLGPGTGQGQMLGGPMTPQTQTLVVMFPKPLACML